jgi:hypothetical protein
MIIAVIFAVMVIVIWVAVKSAIHVMSYAILNVDMENAVIFAMSYVISLVTKIAIKG